MPVARSEPLEVRVIAHVDLDCFYVQVEQRRHPEFKGKPTAVVMYNPWKGGGIIAVGYEARSFGVTRNMRGDDAKKVCPEINLIQVPTHFGKADLSDYRDAGSEVVAVFSRGGVCERASIDEVYLDITETANARLRDSPAHAAPELSAQVLGTHIVGLEKVNDGTMGVEEWMRRDDEHASSSDQLLACGAMIIAELRTAVLEETGFTTSAGIAHNKMLAKLASGMHKPAQQTLIPSCGAPGLLAALPIKKIRGLGGKLGKDVESKFGIKTVGDLLPYPESKLQDLYGTNTGTWLWRVARGMNGDEVAGRTLPKSHGCGKTFPGPKALKDLNSVAHWLLELAGELQERLDEDLTQNNRTAKLLVCHATCPLGSQGDTSTKSFPSKSCAIRYGRERIAADALQLFKRALNEFCPGAQSVSPVKDNAGNASARWGVTSLTLAANNMVDLTGTIPITQFFGAPSSVKRSTSGEQNAATRQLLPPSPPQHETAALEEALDEEDVDAEMLMLDKAAEENPPTAESSYSGRPDSPSGGEGTIAFGFFHEDSPFTSGSERLEGANIIIRESDAPNTVDLVRDPDGACSRSDASRLLESKEHSHDNPGDMDPICTPDFGVLGPPVKSVIHLNLPQASPSGIRSDARLINKDEILSADEKIQKTLLHQGAPISCSPVEFDGLAGNQQPLSAPQKDLEGSQVAPELENPPVKDSSRPETLPIDNSKSSPLSEPYLEFSSPEPHLVRSGVAEAPPLSITSTTPVSTAAFTQLDKINETNESVRTSPHRQPGSAATSRKLVFQRVDELWGKSSRPPEKQQSLPKGGGTSWSYKQGEIDQDVLSELPEEMQRELRKELGLKRRKLGKSSISDFFRSSAPPAK